MIEKLNQQIVDVFGAESIVELHQNGLQPSLQINPVYLPQVCLWLRDHSEYYFDFLSNITAVDYYPATRFAIVYHLTSIPYQFQLTLKVFLDNDRSLDNLPELPSVSSIWKTAEWHEREAFDLMGIYFTDHPDLRRILLPDDWQGFPLRKDYKDAESYHGISLN